MKRAAAYGFVGAYVASGPIQLTILTPRGHVIPANDILHEEIEHLLTRPVGRLPKRPMVLYHDFSYRAASWARPRRVIAKVEWYQGELFPRVGFIVTTMSAKARNVVRFYNKRGNCEQWIKEGKRTLTWTRLSCTRFSSNQVRLALFVLAYNLGNFLRRLALPSKVAHWRFPAYNWSSSR